MSSNIYQKYHKFQIFIFILVFRYVALFLKVGGRLIPKNFDKQI